MFCHLNAAVHACPTVVTPIHESSAFRCSYFTFICSYLHFLFSEEHDININACTNINVKIINGCMLTSNYLDYTVVGHARRKLGKEHGSVIRVNPCGFIERTHILTRRLSKQSCI